MRVLVRRLRRALSDLAREKGDLKALEPPLHGYVASASADTASCLPTGNGEPSSAYSPSGATSCTSCCWNTCWIACDRDQARPGNDSRTPEEARGEEVFVMAANILILAGDAAESLEVLPFLSAW